MAANSKHTSYAAVVVLAYLHRYLFPILVVFIPFLFSQSRDAYMLYLGIGMLAFAAYGLIGYLCRWKHIFCSYQNAYHQKMTPNRIRWDIVKKSDAYGIPIIFAVFGILCIIVRFTAM